MQTACWLSFALRGKPITEKILRDMTRLSREQHSAIVYDLDLPLMISAAPGSGKTSVIASRVSLIQEKYPKCPISCISFTNIASKELKGRTSKTGNLWCGTIHKQAMRIIAAADALCKRVGTANEVFKAFLIACKRQKLDIGDADDLPDDNTSTWEIAGSATRIFNSFTRQRETGSINDPVVSTLNTYFDEELDKLGVCDIHTLLTSATSHLLNPTPELGKWLTDNIAFVLVDEAQDCSVPQWRFLHALTAGFRLSVVGDPNQQIFAFSGAAGFHEIFREFFPKGNACRLSFNFRSVPSIVDFACKIHAHSCVSQNLADEGFAKIQLFQPGQNSLSFVASEICRMKKELKLKNSDFAVLARLNAAAQRATYFLREAGLRCGAQSAKTEEFIISVFKLVANPNDSHAFSVCMNIPCFGLTPKIQAALQSLHADLSLLSLKKSELAKIRKFQETLISLTAKVKCMQPRYAVLHVIKSLSLSMTDQILDLLGEAAESPNLLDLVEARSGSITVGTIHSSKGTEKEAVFVIDCDADVLPLEGCELNGERNVMYVAVTRARRFLWLLGSARRPSIFLEELLHK